MTAVSELDIRSCVSTSLINVFDTMLSMDVEVSASDDTPSFNGNEVLGSVSFAGDVKGMVRIHLSGAFARLMTAALLDTEPEEIDGEEDINDVVAEISNMIGGNLKSKLCDAGFPCELSVPSVTHGTHFQVESRDWNHQEELMLRHQEYQSLVIVSIR